MDLKKIENILITLEEECEYNYVPAQLALRPELAGIKMFEGCLVGCTNADDSIFAEMKGDFKAYGDMLRLPESWLPGAKSVISFYLPYAADVKVPERAGTPYPSDEWLHARIEGQNFIVKACEEIVKALEAEGYKCLVPSLSSEFASSRDEARAAAGGPLYVSNWSERHAAYAAGLGTFGLSKNLITEKGTCGRFASIITDAPLELTPRKYSSPYEYCTFCGACSRRCPSGAIGEKEKDLIPCSAFINRTKELFVPRYGCSKCQIGMPCEKGIPKK